MTRVQALQMEKNVVLKVDNQILRHRLVIDETNKYLALITWWSKKKGGVMGMPFQEDTQCC